jgi:PAS domain S-box-containing protein
MLCDQISRAEVVNSAGEMRFDAFMRNIPAVAFIKDADGRMVYVNHLFEELWRTTLTECRGKKDDELWPPELARLLRLYDLHVQRPGERIEVIESVPMPDGIKREFLISKFTYADSQGGVFLGGIGIDITEHQKAEDELGKQACQQSVIARLASQALFQNDIGSVLADATMLMAQVLNVEYCGFFEFATCARYLRPAPVGTTSNWARRLPRITNPKSLIPMNTENR